MTTTLSQLATDLSNAVSAKATGGKPQRTAKAPQTPVARGTAGKGKAAASAPKAQPAPAVAAPQATAPAPQGPRYALGKPFVAKAGGRFPQAENWAALVPLLPATKAELVAALKAAECPNAAGFVQGRIRGGHIVATGG